MSELLSPNVIFHGSHDAPAVPVSLTAGPLEMDLEDGQLRHIRLGRHEVVLRIYAAVRDECWNTIPGCITDFDLDQQAASFRVRFESVHDDEANGIDFAWRAEITGEADGTVRYEFDGTARSAFRKNRIGLCVLHPLSVAGRACGVEYVSGDVAGGAFPEFVDPVQPVCGLHDFRVLRHEITPGVQAEISFDGDVFEIEDQRNWTDASFKSYSTPQRIPIPAVMRPGQRVRQSVVLRLLTEKHLPPAVPRREPAEVTITVGESCGSLPEFGLDSASNGQPLTEIEITRLSRMGARHLREDLDLSGDEWPAKLERTLHASAAIGCGVELALHVHEEHAAAQLESLLQRGAQLGGRVLRWLVLTKGQPATTAATLTAARTALARLGAPIGGGTDSDFFQLNNDRPPREWLDFVFVPMRPCAHQFDHLTLFENLAGQRAVLDTLRQVYPGLPVHVSPVSLRTRAQKGPPAPPGHMPPQADVRQMSLVCAAWTAGCLKALGEHGGASATLFQTTGWRGVMETAAGSAAPGLFHSLPGAVFPVYHLLAMLAPWQGAMIVRTVSSNPLAADALVLKKAARTRAMAINFSPQPRRIQLADPAGAPLFHEAVLTRLDASTAMAAMLAPESFPDTTGRALNGLIDLPPFGLAAADFAGAG